MLTRMNEHALSIVTDGYRRFVPGQAAIDVAVSSFDCGVVRQFVRDSLPVASGRNCSVSIDYIIGVPRSHMVEIIRCGRRISSVSRTHFARVQTSRVSGNGGSHGLRHCSTGGRSSMASLTVTYGRSVPGPCEGSGDGPQ